MEKRPASKEQQALDMVMRSQRFTDRDVLRYQVKFFGDGNSFSVRLDYTALAGGGYQHFFGEFGVSVFPSSSVMGKGRVTPYKKLVSPVEIGTQEEFEQAKQKALHKLQYEPTIDDGRIA